MSLTRRLVFVTGSVYLTRSAGLVTYIEAGCHQNRQQRVSRAVIDVDRLVSFIVRVPVPDDPHVTSIT